MEVISFVGAKKVCLLVQFPPSVRIGNIKQLSLLMGSLRVQEDHMRIITEHVIIYSNNFKVVFAQYLDDIIYLMLQHGNITSDMGIILFACKRGSAV
ncbi:hypothetical protein AAKU52_002029 [Pedobacter sp. CG_S7]